MNQETKIIGGIVLLSLVILLGAVFFLSKPAPPDTTEDITKLLVKADSNKIASDSAKVTIVEFGDYQCPACAQANPQVKQVLAEYPGKVNFVFRHFPLPQHGNALIAAEAAEAAGAQGKYWEMHDKLYTSQNEWSENPSALAIFTRYAQEMGLNTEQFKSAVSANQSNDKIMSDKNDGETLRVNSTPTFYLNGVKMRSFYYADFKQQIDSVYKDSN